VCARFLGLHSAFHGVYANLYFCSVTHI
jgi:hypothetical protein